VPIPEGCPIRKGMERLYADFQKALDLFALKHSTASKKMFVLPKGLERFTHLDPDFEFLSYGNPLNNKGDILNGLKKNDAVVFLRD
jgi:hypothetical protein